jgi:alkylated DNA nucleotide flippase Atl1
MDRDKLRAVVEGIPSGSWMSYADVCVAAGGFPDEARSVNRRLMELEIGGAHRACARTARSRRRRSAMRSGCASC